MITPQGMGPFRLGEQYDDTWVESLDLEIEQIEMGDDADDTWLGLKINLGTDYLLLQLRDEDSAIFEMTATSSCFELPNGIKPGVLLTDFLEHYGKDIVPESEFYDLEFVDPKLKVRFWFDDLMDVGGFYGSDDYEQYLLTRDIQFLEELPFRTEARLTAIQIAL
ncbi:hypothetical protein [Pontibacter sp. G13]|uniref:hypothetical protein n=1 Tax=Pontibacter sp. G13 TaxID=3074898 RepID=UPI0028890A71|nr:hypothetical protein [Pontibacter sp. G13]WNJ20166.1 hypothetical protein RJD25_06775 [Pontibacter sp. G13]